MATQTIEEFLPKTATFKENDMATNQIEEFFDKCQETFEKLEEKDMTTFKEIKTKDLKS